MLRTFRSADEFIEYKDDRAATYQEYAADSAALFGKWRWEITYGGYGGGRGSWSPEAGDCYRLLDLRRNGTYVLQRKGCGADSLICSGLFSIHPARSSHIEDGPRADLWVELIGWVYVFWEPRELIAFLDPATIVMYPGAEAGHQITFVSDASKYKFVREPDDNAIASPTDSDTTDSRALVGTWRWVRSYGSWGTDIRPPTTGWSRYLYFPGDRTYSFWEEDSVENYFWGGGEYTFHAMGTARHQPWIELPGWQGYPGRANRWIRFFGPDTLTLYPGGGNRVVSDDNYEVFVRTHDKEIPRDDPSEAGHSWRPPRLWNYEPGLYGVYLPAAFNEALGRIGQLSEWKDSAYDWAHYRYTNGQVPSAVIGDFDGDSLADVVVHGFEGSGERVVCLLSNHAKVRALTVISQPLAFVGPVRPDFYLELFPAGEIVEGPRGGDLRLETDAIRATSRNGESKVYYFWHGNFQESRAR